MLIVSLMTRSFSVIEKCYCSPLFEPATAELNVRRKLLGYGDQHFFITITAIFYSLFIVPDRALIPESVQQFLQLT